VEGDVWMENVREDRIRREKINMSTFMSIGWEDELVQVVFAKVTCTNPEALRTLG
jgi:hypothetical protein